MDWSRLASSYDWQLPLERRALDVAVAIAEPRRDDIWLDVATGTGGLLRRLALRDERPGEAVGADASAAMLAKAGPLPAGWSLTEADARRLPFGDGDFTVVTAAYLLHVVDAVAQREILNECRRVLRPGGRLVVVTPAWPPTRIARWLYAPFAATARSSVGPAAALRPLDPTALLTQAMFTVTATRYVGRGYPSLCVSATR